MRDESTRGGTALKAGTAFTKVSALKQAMRAARVIVKTQVEKSARHRVDAESSAGARPQTVPVRTVYKGGHTGGARIVADRGGRDAEVLATDGYRLCSMKVPIAEERLAEAVDMALPLEALRAIANTTGSKRIELTATESGCRIGFGTVDGKEIAYPAADTWGTRTYHRILDEEPMGAPTATIKRAEACKRVRAARPDNSEYNPDRLCRVTISPKEVRIWPTRRRNLRPETGAGQILSTDVMRCDEPMVLGVSHHMLVEALRALPGDSVTMTVKSQTHPMHLRSNNGRTHYIMMPFALVV